jgi:superfamily II DNA or RNA helicase
MSKQEPQITADTNPNAIPAVAIKLDQTGASSKQDERGMRPMQSRAYDKRGEQYLLIKSPPASGKSRALMFIALDKLENQGVKQAIIVVPERSIGGSFSDEKLSQYGFFKDWEVKGQWNLCNAPGVDEPKVAKSKVKAVGEFLASDDRILVCTHATFRFAIEDLGIEAFDGRLIAVDEFHHVSANPDNKLGSQLGQLIMRDQVHIVAMTGSYFRGDAVAVLAPDDEAKFETVTYTYYEQLNGYTYLKSLAIGYSFYVGRYLDKVMQVLDPSLKTIIHIPSVNSRESLKNKHKEVEEIMDYLGVWVEQAKDTGFHHVKVKEGPNAGKILRIADLVDDSDSVQRTKVLNALKHPDANLNRDHVDIIIALGMAKEGFDWIWCEHALTVGYRSSLTEVVQIIGRATRDAPEKYSAKFTNLIAEPDADESAVASAINDTLKAIAASLLMEQVLTPRFEFTSKSAGPKKGFDYGEKGYVEGSTNVGVNVQSGAVHIEVNGIYEPKSKEAQRIVKEDINELVTAFVQDTPALEKGIFDHENTIPEELTQVRMSKIVKEKYPNLDDKDVEAVRQHAIAAMVITQQAKKAIKMMPGDQKSENTSLIDGIRQFSMDVRYLDIDLIDRINPFDSAYAILAKAMDERTLRQVEVSIAAKRAKIPFDEAKDLALRAVAFKKDKGRNPDINSQDSFERLLAAGVAAFARYKAEEDRKEGK